jgi:hypothetical protein
MSFSITDSTVIIGLFILIVGIMSVVVIQFLRIRMFKKLFKELSSVYGKGMELDYNSLIERIILSKEIYHAGSSSEVVDMISDYIGRIIAGSKVFIHIAPDKVTAEKIMMEGFKYSEDFHKSTEEISSDLYDLAYKLQLFRPYGKFVIIISIPKDLFRESGDSVLTGEKDALAEYGISEYNPDNEMRYTLPSKFIFGFADIENKKIVENKLFGTRI